MRMMNLLTRAGWEARILAAQGGSAVSPSLDETISALVDYLLFVGEAPLDGVRGTSGFAEHFSARGPRDGKGRSLRDLDLRKRLMRYPCSYMIYAEAFDALPAGVREAIYGRLKDVLTRRRPRGEVRASDHRRSAGHPGDSSRHETEPAREFLAPGPPEGGHDVRIRGT